MEIIAEQNILLDLDTHDMTALVLDPVFNYDNILQRNLGLYKVITGKRKAQMLHLNKPGYNLQPKGDCDSWNPTVNFSLRPFEIETCDWEMNGEQCPDTFEEGCLQNLASAPEEMRRFESLLGNAPQYDPIEVAMMMQLRRGLSDDLYKVGWFGNENFQKLIDDGMLDLTYVDPKNRKNMIAMMSHCNGWWSEIGARAALPTSDEWNRVRYVDTNNGTTVGNALRAENICRYLRTMRAMAHPLLKFWNRQRPRSEWPAYFLQQGLYEAYLEYLTSKDISESYMLKIDGVPVEGVYMFEGYQVISVAEWDVYDYETGQMNPVTGQSYNQRALFSARENFCTISHAEQLDGRPGSSFAIQKDPSLKAKGKSYMYGQFGFGFGVAQPILMVAGWNSTRTYN